MSDRAGEGGRGRTRGAPAGVTIDRTAAREIDRLAAERYGLRSIVLMENAAREVALAALDMTAQAEPARVLIVCGPGNNGGDGLGAARHLHNAGAVVSLLVPAGPMRPGSDGAEQHGIVRAMGLGAWSLGGGAPAEAAERAAEALGGVGLVVDAMFGTGLDRPLSEPWSTLAGWINQKRRSGTLVLAVDVPSGLDCDTGRAMGTAVRADVTVTFCAPRPGFLELGAQAYVGEVVVGDIGVPRELIEELGVPVRPLAAADDDAGPDEPPAATPHPGDSASV